MAKPDRMPACRSISMPPLLALVDRPPLVTIAATLGDDSRVGGRALAAALARAFPAATVVVHRGEAPGDGCAIEVAYADGTDDAGARAWVVLRAQEVFGCLRAEASAAAG